MADCSELKGLYKEAREKAEDLRREADRDKHEFEDSESDYNFEKSKDCGLYHIVVPLPDDMAGIGVDNEGAAACLKDRALATEHARQKMERDRERMVKSESEAEDAEGDAEFARNLWCTCEEQNKHDDSGWWLPSQMGDWNESEWDDYMIA